MRREISVRTAAPQRARVVRGAALTPPGCASDELLAYDPEKWLAVRPELVQIFFNTLFQVPGVAAVSKASMLRSVCNAIGLYYKRIDRQYIAPGGAELACALRALSGVGPTPLNLVAHQNGGVPSASWLDDFMDKWAQGLTPADALPPDWATFIAAVFDNFNSKAKPSRSRMQRYSVAVGTLLAHLKVGGPPFMLSTGVPTHRQFSLGPLAGSWRLPHQLGTFWKPDSEQATARDLRRFAEFSDILEAVQADVKVDDDGIVSDYVRCAR